MLNLFLFNLHHYHVNMAKKNKKESELVAFSVRLPRPLYDKLYNRAKDQKRSVNKESELIFEKELI